MTGLTILLVGFAGLLLVCVLIAIYVHESQNWQTWWRPDDEGTRVGEVIQTRPVRRRPEPPARDTVDVGDMVVRATGEQAYPRDVFAYSIRRPLVAVRRKVADLGGYSEIRIRMYDQRGNRLTVNQKVRLN